MFFLLLFSGPYFLFFSDSVRAAEWVPPKGGILLLLVDDFTFPCIKDWMADSPDFRRLVERGYIGAMTMRTLGGKGAAHQMATLITGRREVGSSSLLHPFHFAGRNAFFLFPPGGKSSFSYAEGVGNRLREGGIDSLFIYENGVGTDFLEHPGSSFVVDRRGWGKRGEWRGGVPEREATFMVKEWRRKKRTGWASKLPIAGTETILERKELLSFLLWNEAVYGEDREIWITTVRLDPLSERRGDFLAPLLFLPPRKGTGKEGGGILTSPTTKREGFVANVDLFPSILSHFGLSSPVREGRSIERVEGKELQSFFFDELEKAFYVHRTRPSFLYQVIVIQVGGLSFLFLVGILMRRIPFWMKKAAHYLLLYILLIPFFLLILGAKAPALPFWLYHLYLAAGGVLIAFFLRRLEIGKIYLWISGLYVGALLLDGVLGNPMMKHSFLGYDPIIAARFYGIGNEYAGLLIGGGILFLYLLLEFRRGVFPHLLLYGGILLYFALPNLGTNAGGFLAWLSFLFFLLPRLGIQIRKGGGVIFGGLLGVFLFSLFLLSQWGVDAEEKSHVGWILEQTAREGPRVLMEMMMRKVKMNLHLVQASTWNKLFFFSLLVLAWHLLRSRPIERGSLTYWDRALRALFWVNMVSLTVNDSGLVSAAMGLLFAVTPLLHLAILHSFPSSNLSVSSSQN